MNSKTYLIIGGVVLVLLFGYFLMKGQYQQSSPETQNVTTSSEIVQPSPTAVVIVPTGATESGKVVNKIVSVDYVDGGFSPKSITVKAGTTVTWTNKAAAKQMWVASAVHPTHQLLPGFDQLASVGKSGTYSYTFTKVGSWKYHNHVSPSDTGVVIVE